ncbi:MAG TPA: hypothetical protein VJZ76_19800 [Thermoanaerobaculia bacterium]|nr:hypothetical protein [Thermoanaerobaculia bacterium]
MTTFRVATPADDAVVRALLRETAMPSWADMAIEREPSSYDWAVVAEENDDVIGVYIASVIPAHVDGNPQRLGYLGGLRVRPEHRRRIRHLREGYASVPALAQEKVPWWFTTIGADNEAARRLLEAGVRGLPQYHFRGEYVTFALPTSRGRRRGIWRRGADVALHNDLAAQFQCSPVLNDETVDRIGNFFICDGGVAALWDQRAFKRIVAARYRTPSLIPLYNAYAKLARRIPLPRQGQALDHTFIAFFAMRTPSVEAIEDLLSHCTTPIATIGMHAENPLREIVQRFKPMSTRSRVYAVAFDGSVPPNGRPAQPEAALL